jgi:hypothetical protein
MHTLKAKLIRQDLVKSKEAAMERHGLRRAVLCLVAVVLTALPVHTAVTTNISIPITLVVDIPCAGELVVLNGPLHILSTLTFDRGGGFHMVAHFQPKGIRGLGQVSGAKYQATGITEFQTNAKAVPFETSFVNNFKIIGQGPGNNLLIHENFHLTVNANGRLTAFIDNSSFECR